MKTLSSLLLVSFFALSTSAFAQVPGPQGGATPAPEMQMQNLPEIDPAASNKGGCEKCKKKGMDDMSGMGGMGGCQQCKKAGMSGAKGHGEGGCPKHAALEHRIDELEKRLDLLQMLLMRGYR